MKTPEQLKGGLLISAILGIEERTTMDMDTTVKGLSMDEGNIRRIVEEIRRKQYWQKSMKQLSAET